MKTLNWRRTDWNGRSFIFSVGQVIVGELTFASAWNSTATYTDKHTELKFSQKSFWDSNVAVTRDNKPFGEIYSGLWGEKTLKLVTGERFILSTSFWEQEVYWKTAKGETMITYRQAAMSSMEKGVISINGSLATEVEKLLISSGLFIRQVARKRLVRTVAVITPVIAAASRL
ncbi:hypothetical protein [Pontibacter akesuensis]|uniref:Uncharacterized protein n=1 Tax=Pontibacter akesuensis TaxID=388950 RepID=A0A1I7KV66_9BACT|nr:hypothetical protein [Pontibacter akesuensis]GHA78259.1 hypothetical protein GCM10007389_35340 [Pontibacter akesuensis]SFV01341.1 hypothetical protein SAMN04487941_4150 [Pontibacter akesuensis]